MKGPESGTKQPAAQTGHKPRGDICMAVFSANRDLVGDIIEDVAKALEHGSH